MTKEHLEGQDHEVIPDSQYSVNLGDVVDVIRKSNRLLSVQKDILIADVLKVENIGEAERKLDVYKQFAEKVKKGLVGIEWEFDRHSQDEMLANFSREIFRTVLNIDIDDLSLLERMDLQRVISDQPNIENDPDIESIDEIFTFLEDQLAASGERDGQSTNN